MHNVADHRIAGTDQQIAQGYRAHQFALGVQHIADIDGFAVHPDLPDPGNGLLHRHIFFQIHIFHRHNASGGILRILKQVVNISSCLGICIGKKLFHYIGRHFLQQIRSIIRHQVVDDACRILFRQAGNDKLLALHLHIRKHICRQILGKNPQNFKHVPLVKLLHDRGNIRPIHLRYFLAQRGILLCFKHFLHKIKIFYFFHGILLGM